MGMTLSAMSFAGQELFPKGNPDPNNYKIRKHIEKNGWVVVAVKYPDCENHEGNKILVYRNTTMASIRRQTTLDPHFSNNPEFLSPFARFEPTWDGWYAAIKFICILEKEIMDGKTS